MTSPLSRESSLSLQYKLLQSHATACHQSICFSKCSLANTKATKTKNSPAKNTQSCFPTKPIFIYLLPVNYILIKTLSQKPPCAFTNFNILLILSILLDIINLSDIFTFGRTFHERLRAKSKRKGFCRILEG